MCLDLSVFPLYLLNKSIAFWETSACPEHISDFRKSTNCADAGWGADGETVWERENLSEKRLRNGAHITGTVLLFLSCSEHVEEKTILLDPLARLVRPWLCPNMLRAGCAHYAAASDPQQEDRMVLALEALAATGMWPRWMLRWGPKATAAPCWATHCGSQIQVSGGCLSKCRDNITARWNKHRSVTFEDFELELAATWFLSYLKSCCVLNHFLMSQKSCPLVHICQLFEEHVFRRQWW